MRCASGTHTNTTKFIQKTNTTKLIQKKPNTTKLIQKKTNTTKLIQNFTKCVLYSTGTQLHWGLSYKELMRIINLMQGLGALSAS